MSNLTRIPSYHTLNLTEAGTASAWVSNTFHHYCLQFRNEE
ncbi:MAG: hypothetical protein U0X92_11840 [Anaerolineales bacterium]